VSTKGLFASPTNSAASLRMLPTLPDPRWSDRRTTPTFTSSCGINATPLKLRPNSRMRSIAKDGHMFLSIACNHARPRSCITWRNYSGQSVITADGDASGVLGFPENLLLGAGLHWNLKESRKPESWSKRSDLHRGQL